MEGYTLLFTPKGGEASPIEVGPHQVDSALDELTCDHLYTVEGCFTWADLAQLARLIQMHEHPGVSAMDAARAARDGELVRVVC